MTPTSYLVMEVLAARWRLGFDYWTFPSDHVTYRKALVALQAAGYLTFRFDSSNNFMTELTPHGINIWGLNKPMADSTRARPPQ